MGFFEFKERDLPRADSKIVDRLSTHHANFYVYLNMDHHWQVIEVTGEGKDLASRSSVRLIRNRPPSKLWELFQIVII